MATESQDSIDHRTRADRRQRPTTFWSACRPGGRRRRVRREAETREGYFVDLLDPATFALAILLLVLTLIDGVITLILLEAGCEEVNPAMDYLLHVGPLAFLMGKYVLTTACLPFLLIFRHFPLFRTRFRVGYLLPIFVGLYCILLGYQIVLMTSPPSWPTGVGPTKPTPSTPGQAISCPNSAPNSVKMGASPLLAWAIPDHFDAELINIPRVPTKTLRGRIDSPVSRGFP